MLSKTLKKLRQQRKITQEQLANEIKIDRSSIAKYESTNSMPSIEVLLSLRNYFNVTLDYLLTGQEQVAASDLYGEQEKDLISTFHKLPSEKERWKAIARFEDIVKFMLSEISAEITVTTDNTDKKMA